LIFSYFTVGRFGGTPFLQELSFAARIGGFAADAGGKRIDLGAARPPRTPPWI
jgi:hypothetical protein